MIDTAALLAIAEAALAGGAVLLQYRNKLRDLGLRQLQATALRELACTFCVPFIVNDDLDLACAVAADGVHLGRDDADVQAAREMLGSEAIIGASCYASPVLARQAVAAGASYVAFGTVFVSPTKPHAPRAPLSLFAECDSPGVPTVAIGGINLDNAQRAIDAGADLIAVISAISDADNPTAIAAQFAHMFRKDELPA